MNRDVELLPPALIRTVLASSNIQWAEASLGWLGTVGIILALPLNLQHSKILCFYQMLELFEHLAE